VSLNGSGVFNVNSSGQPVVGSTIISASVFNALTADIATALSTALYKDGQQTVTAHIPFAGFKITGLGAATARTDAASLANLQDATGVYVATVGGTADAITLTPSPAITAYAAGQTFRFIASGANTTAVTVQVSGLASPKALTKDGATALVAGDIASGELVTIIYDGTRFQLGHAGSSLIQMGAFTRDVSVASGTTTFVHGGTKAPKAVIFFASGAGVAASWGAGIVGGVVGAMYTRADDGLKRNSSSFAMGFFVDASNFQTGAPSSADATNVTITWTKTASPTGILSVDWIAFF
jgi:hypothetical protein